jgi:hypothetical protein
MECTVGDGIFQTRTSFVYTIVDSIISSSYFIQFKIFTTRDTKMHNQYLRDQNILCENKN